MTRPLSSAPVAPDASARRRVVSTTLSASTPNAWSRLAESINSVLVNGVTAPSCCNSLMIRPAFSALPVSTCKLRAWLSSSAVFANTNLIAWMPANAMASLPTAAAMPPNARSVCCAWPCTCRSLLTALLLSTLMATLATTDTADLPSSFHSKLLLFVLQVKVTAP